MERNETMKLPLAKTKDVVVQDLHDEVLVYDLTTDRAYCLNKTSKIVYRHCDGHTSFADLKSRYNFSDDLLYFALDELKRENLIEPTYVSPLAGINRRDLIRRIGLASMTALPVIAALAAPTAASAASTCVNTTGPQRAPNTYLGYRSPAFCANDAVTCCSNSTRYDTGNCMEINNVTHQIGCQCYCN